MVKNMKKDKFEIQDNQYIKPYHHLLDLKKYKFFDVISWGLEYYSYVSFVIEYFEKILKNKNIENIAEVGCGDGKILLELAMRYEDILFEGFDLSKRAVLFANAFSYGFDNLKFFDHDFKNSKKKYDVILCIETLEHIPDDEINDFLKTINNNLKNDGILLLTVPTTNLKLHPKHYRHYNIDLLKKHTELYFNLKEVQFIHNFNSVKTRILNGLLINNIVILNNYKLRASIIKYYKENLRGANSTNAAHLFAVFEKK